MLPPDIAANENTESCTSGQPVSGYSKVLSAVLAAIIGMIIIWVSPIHTQN